MKQILGIAALTVLVLLFGGESATALPIRIDTCTSSPCNTEGGSVDALLEFYPDLFGLGVVITATNNLVSGAVTQLAFDFAGAEPYLEPLFTGFTPLVGSVTLLSWTSFCSRTVPFQCEDSPFDLSLTFPSSGANAWGPGETFGLALSLRLASSPFGGTQDVGYAQVEGACAPSNPAPCLPSGIGGSESYQLSGGPVSVPDESSTLLLAAMGFTACVLARRRCSRAQELSFRTPA
jgi:hypothetical protein